MYCEFYTVSLQIQVRAILPVKKTILPSTKGKICKKQGFSKACVLSVMITLSLKMISDIFALLFHLDIL